MDASISLGNDGSSNRGQDRKSGHHQGRVRGSAQLGEYSSWSASPHFPLGARMPANGCALPRCACGPRVRSSYLRAAWLGGCPRDGQDTIAVNNRKDARNLLMEKVSRGPLLKHLRCLRDVGSLDQISCEARVDCGGASSALSLLARCGVPSPGLKVK